MFEKLSLKFNKKIFDKESDVSRVKTKEFNLPLVNAKDGDNGVMYYGRSEDFESAEMTIDIVSDGAVSTGNVYSQPQKTGVLYNAYLIKPMFSINEKLLHFFTSTIQKSIKLKFSYENKAGWEKVKEEKIQLPTKNGKIDFAFMESFIAELEAQRIAELEAYLLTTGLKDYTLTEAEKQALADFENDMFEWAEFKIEDVLQWQLQKEIDPLKLEELKDETEKMYPFYGQATINNGIISYHQLTKKVLNNQDGKPTILIHSNNQNIVYVETPFYLKDGHGATSVLQCENLNRINQMCIVASIDKVIKSKYSYNYKATKIELKNTVIKLPTKNNQPDYSTMQTLISAIQKLVIKEVVQYADRKIEATKQVVG